MAIYHCHTQVIGRSAGRSSTAAAAYRSATVIHDLRLNIVFDYQNKHGVDHSMIVAPTNAPSFVHNRAALWNAVERREIRYDAQVCREMDIAIPHELPRTAMIALVERFVEKEFVSRRMVADVSFHHLDSTNPHAHIMLTLRHLTADGFGLKNRDWNKKGLLEQWRESWADCVNTALSDAGAVDRIDHRTLAAQGIERLPQLHLGPVVAAMERKNKPITARRERFEQVAATNAQLLDLQAQMAIIDAQIALTEFPTTFIAATNTGRTDSSDSISDFDTVKIGIEKLPHIASEARGNTVPISAGTTAGVGMVIDHTYIAVTRQLEALSCARYEVGIGQPETGQFRVLNLTAQEVLQHVSQLKSHNAQGEDIYIRPAVICASTDDTDIPTPSHMLSPLSRETETPSVEPLNSGLILVDNLSLYQLERMKADGLLPALVVESFPSHFQAWVRVSPVPLLPAVATCVGQLLEQRYAAARSADRQHFGRLAGFTSHKSHHVGDDLGSHPFVLVHAAGGGVAVAGPALVAEAEQVLADRQLRLPRIEAASKLLGLSDGQNPTDVYRRHLKLLQAQYGVGIDYSRADLMVCKSMACRGMGFTDLTQALSEASPALQQCNMGLVKDYIECTVLKVLEDSEVLAARKQIAQRDTQLESQTPAIPRLTGLDERLGKIHSEIEPPSGHKPSGGLRR